MTRNRKGFTLIELLLVTVLGSLVVGASLQILIQNRRAYTAQTQVINGQQTTRMAIEVLFAELREISPSGGDILAMWPDSIRVRMMRKFSIVCDMDLSGDPVLTIQRDVNDMSLMYGANAFAVGDSAHVYADNDQDIISDDVWIAAEITDVDLTPVPSICPQNPLSPATAIELEFGSQSGLFSADQVWVGAPIRSYQEFTFGTTTMNGDVFLARRDTADYVPVAGPLAATDGLRFIYRDSLGAITATPANVSQIEVRILTGNEISNSVRNMVQDSVSVWIYTRN